MVRELFELWRNWRELQPPKPKVRRYPLVGCPLAWLSPWIPFGESEIKDR
jgi:hypothetical protein